MSMYSGVRVDLRDKLLAVPGIPSAVAWEGRRFTPDPTAPYVSEKLTPAGSEVATLGSDGETRDDFIYQIVLHFPQDDDMLRELEDLADAVRYAFPTGSQVGSVEDHGRVVSTERTSLMAADNWMSIAVRVRAFVYRATLAARAS